MQSKTVVLAVAAVFAAVAFLPAGAIGVPVELEKSRWIVGFYDMPLETDEYEGDEVVKVDHDLRYFVVETANPLGLQLKVKLDDNVRYIETDVSDHKLNLVPNDYFYTHSSNWGVQLIGAEQAWDRTLGSSSVKDTHLDSGIVIGHEDLSGSRFLSGWDYYSNDATPEDSSGCNWHGSHTAGTVGATINNGLGFAGMAQITIEPMKIFGGALCWAASTSAMADALKAAGDNGAAISSNSWGGGSYSQAIDDAIQYSENLGTLFIASAGNDGCNNCIGNPWKTQEDGVMIVTSTTSSDTGSSFNSKGPEVDISAPGDGVGSAGGPGNDYYIMSGTSMAAPHVAGLAGLVKSLNPSWTATQITNQITSTAVDLGPAGHDDEFGHGRIDADAATAGGPPADPACSDGIDNDGDGLTDYPADPGCTDANDNDEYNAPPSNDEVHVHDLDIWKQGKNRKFKVWAFDDQENAESGVSVSVSVTHDSDSDSATGTATTGADGTVTFNWKHGSGPYTLCVTDLSKSGFTWDVAGGHASAGNCHTETT